MGLGKIKNMFTSRNSLAVLMAIAYSYTSGGLRFDLIIIQLQYYHECICSCLWQRELLLHNIQIGLSGRNKLLIRPLSARCSIKQDKAEIL